MKATFCFVGVLALTVSAAADVRIFFTNSADPYGLDKRANAFQPTAGKQRDWTDGEYSVTNFPPPTPIPPDPVIWGDQWAYIWVRFENEPNGRKIEKLDLRVLGLIPTDAAYYVCDETAGVDYKRWDGAYTPPDFPEFKRLERQILVGVLAYGIQNTAGNVPWNLYKGGSARTTLLGAVRFGNQVGWFSFDPWIFGHDIWTPPYDPQPVGRVWVNIPEPGAFLLLIAVGVLVLRRR